MNYLLNVQFIQIKRYPDEHAHPEVHVTKLLLEYRGHHVSTQKIYVHSTETNLQTW